MATKTLANIRDRLEAEIQIDSSDGYVDSTEQLDDINEAYRMTADEYDWPTLLERTALIPTAAVGRYTLPTNFRKARYVKVLGIEKSECELLHLPHSPDRYAIDRVKSDLVLREIPQTAPTAFTLAGSESAGSAVTIGLDTSTGLSAGDEIFIDAATAANEEFTFVSTVPDSTSITARLKSAKAGSDIIYLVREIIDLQYYKNITALSDTADTLLLPDAVDFIVPIYAASLYFDRQQQFDRAKEKRQLWEERLARAWKAHDKLSTGDVISFSL